MNMQQYSNSREHNDMTLRQNTSKALPLVPEIGIVTLVPQKWDAPWSTRHHLMNRLARYFPIAWVNPAVGWRETLTRLGNQKPDDHSIAVDPIENLMVHDWQWLPKMY